MACCGRTGPGWCRRKRRDHAGVAVIGNSGGKSVLARQIAERFRLPYVEIDTILWQQGWRRGGCAVGSRRCHLRKRRGDRKRQSHRPDLSIGRAPRAATVKDAAREAVASAKPAQRVLDRASTALPFRRRDDCHRTRVSWVTAPLFLLDHWWEVLAPPVGAGVG